MGAPAGAIGDAGAVAVTGGGAAAEAPAPGSGEAAAEAGGAGVTGGTGSGRSGLGSLPVFSLGASTLALSGLLSRARSPAGFAASLAGLSLSVASVLAGSDLAESGSGLAEPDLAESIAPVSALAASRDASFSVAASPEAGRSIFGGSSVTGRPRLPCFCLTPDLLSVAACTGACPSAGMAASGAARDRPYRFASRPGRVPSPCGRVASVSGREASCAGGAPDGCRRPSRSG